MVLREPEMRVMLLRWLEGQSVIGAGTLVREEFVLLNGEARVDIATVSANRLSAYEIKSANDSLSRLPRQVKLFSQVFEEVSVLVASRYEERVVEMTPDWWGVLVQSDDAIRVRRKSTDNPSPDPLSVARMLWRDEVLAALRERTVKRSFSRASRWTLWELMAEEYEVHEIQAIVRAAIGNRGTNHSSARTAAMW